MSYLHSGARRDVQHCAQGGCCSVTEKSRPLPSILLSLKKVISFPLSVELRGRASRLTVAAFPVTIRYTLEPY
jgi:hypothetical protein